jgi:hypothetical protein
MIDHSAPVLRCQANFDAVFFANLAALFYEARQGKPAIDHGCSSSRIIELP